MCPPSGQFGSLLCDWLTVTILRAVFTYLVSFISLQYEEAGTVCWLALPHDGGDGSEGEGGGDGPGDGWGPSEHQQAGQTAILQHQFRWEIGPCRVCNIALNCNASKCDIWNLCFRSVLYFLQYLLVLLLVFGIFIILRVQTIFISRVQFHYFLCIKEAFNKKNIFLLTFANKRGGSFVNKKKP